MRRFQNILYFTIFSAHTGEWATNLYVQCQWSNPNGYRWHPPTLNHNKTQQPVINVHNSWDVLQVKQILHQNSSKVEKANHIFVCLSTYICINREIFNLTVQIVQRNNQPLTFVTGLNKWVKLISNDVWWLHKNYKLAKHAQQANICV